MFHFPLGGEVPQETSAFVTVRVDQGGSAAPPPIFRPPLAEVTTHDVTLQPLNGGASSFRGVPEDTSVSVPFARLALPGGGSAVVTDVTSDVLGVKRGPLGDYVVYAKTPLDYEAAREHALTFRVDGGRAKSVTLAVLDVNDNPPVFEQATYELDISESVEDTPLMTVRATDRDSGDNGRVTYSLQHSSQGVPRFH